MKKIWVLGTLVRIGSELDDSLGIVFCSIPTTEGGFYQSFDQNDVQIDGQQVKIPAYCDELAPIGSAETVAVEVRPDYEPFMWGSRGIPPETVQVLSSELAEL